VGDAAGDLVQVHQAPLRRGPAPAQDGAAAPPFREERLEGDAGRRALLDHHPAAVPRGPVHPETATIDERADLPNAETPAPAAAAPAAAPALDYQAPAVSAADQAKEFVARIFSDMGGAEEPAAQPQQPPQEEAGAAPESESQLPAIRPGEVLSYMAGRRV